jgi:hypothetical protein
MNVKVVERILFIFAKLNPGQSYVQGMNEICAPLYYTFATDHDHEWRSKSVSHSIYTVVRGPIRLFFCNFFCFCLKNSNKKRVKTSQMGRSFVGIINKVSHCIIQNKNSYSFDHVYIAANIEYAEADCFYCFTNLMGVHCVRDNFVQVLDNSDWGISEFFCFFLFFLNLLIQPNPLVHLVDIVL